MRLIASMVVKDEADRYLDSVLSQLKTLVDGIFIVDDNSADGSVGIARSHGAVVVSRPTEVPSFLEAEGAFREWAWNTMYDHCDISSGDWILGIDADEFVSGDLRAAIEYAEENCYRSLIIPKDEIFLLYPISKRVDAWWGGIQDARLLCYDSGESQEFKKKGMACGSFPRYATNSQAKCDKVRLVHFGYASLFDRKEKYDRYMGIKDNGHSSLHIASIMGRSDLVMYEEELPEVWRGRK